MWLDFHVKLAGGLEKSQQDEPKRNIFQRLVEYRLANRPHRELEFSDACVRWDPTGIHMQSRDAIIVTVEESQKVCGKIMLIPGTQTSDDSKIDCYIPGFIGVGHVNENISRMRVGMKQHLAESQRGAMEALLRDTMLKHGLYRK